MNSTTNPTTISLKVYIVVVGGGIFFLIGIIFYALSAFVVREVATSVSYDLIAPSESVDFLFGKINAAAVQMDLKPTNGKKITDIKHRQWKSSDDLQGVTWDFYDDGQVHISIFSMTYGSDEKFLNIVSLIQKEIVTWPASMKSHLQLAPARFGSCADLDRPHMKDSTCIYEQTGAFDIFELKKLLQSNPAK